MADLVIRAFEDRDEEGVLELLALSLGKMIDDRYRTLFRWKHRDNPFGRSFLWVATSDDRVVGVRSFMRWRFVHADGRRIEAARAVDTATHPDFRRRGLFRSLTLEALTAMEREGVQLVFNTPNQESRPANLTLGWTVDGRTPVAIRPRSLFTLPRLAGARTAAEAWSLPLDLGAAVTDVDGDLVGAPTPAAGHLVTDKTPEVVRWRYAGCPPVASRAVPAGSGAVLVRLRRRGDAIECTVGDVLGAPGAKAAGSAGRAAMRAGGADYAIATRATAVGGMIPVPRLGPIQTRRAVTPTAPSEPLALTMGDLELF